MPNTVSLEERNLAIATCFIYRKRLSGAYEFLILKRASDRPIFPGLWGIAGGGFKRYRDCDDFPDKGGDWKRPLHKTAKREVKEETELKLDLDALTLWEEFFFERSDGVPTLGFRFYAEYPGGKVVLNKEHTEYVWVTAPEAQAYDMLADLCDTIGRLDALLHRVT